VSHRRSFTENSSSLPPDISNTELQKRLMRFVCGKAKGQSGANDNARSFTKFSNRVSPFHKAFARFGGFNCQNLGVD